MDKLLTEDKRNKNKFQQELVQSVSRKIAFIVVIGGLLFCVAIWGINLINQQYYKEKHLNALTQTFQDVYSEVISFIEEEDHLNAFLERMDCDIKNNEIRYMISKYNVNAPIRINLILMDASEQIVFSSYSKEKMNLHRIEFNRIVGVNARNQGEEIYNAVYFFMEDTSEYVFAKPLYEGERYAGSVIVYLNGNDWGSHFSQYQYDSIITSKNGDIIYCSNTNFLEERNTNKYKPKEMAQSGLSKYMWVNESRYLTENRVLKDLGITLYSFIYTPRNHIYIIVGVGTILILGLLWTSLFFRMSRIMAEKTSASVGVLVDEMRIIRKQDKEHVISINTGDEFEEIAEQINKMIKSINELNQRNMELITINSKMEMENLQAQINPHFIYNTLDNIKYLITSEPVRAADLIERFTHILRYSINSTKHKVVLEEDMTYIEDYLVIQKTRFGDRFSYEIDIDDKCNRSFVPKLVLQPLIENSIKYGFKKKMNIEVKIRGWIEKDYLYLTVIDNGPGVPRAMLETIRTIMHAEGTESTHIGLQSINRRIVLDYGKDSGMYIGSAEREGFKVMLKLWIGEKKDV